MSDRYTKLHHLLRLITLMESGNAGNAAALAEQFGLQERTIYRYIQTLNDVGVPCYFDEDARGYRIHRDFFLPPMQLTASETLALTMLAQRVAATDQVTLTGPAARAIEKIRARLPDAVMKELGDATDHIDVRLPATGPAGDAIAPVFDRINHAIKVRRALRCQYESLNDETDPQETFIFRPYALSFDQRSWYTVGEHTGRGEVRRLKLNRFIAVQPTDLPYAIPDDFSLDALRGKAWRMIRGDRTYRVVIRFDAQMADTVDDTHWHPTQDTEWNDDGSLTFTGEVDGLDEIVWWVLGYGPGAKVIEPKELADRVARLAQQTARLYAGPA